ncbi:MAG: site-2 protease family protein [Candidatus Falkowbacteria bacterium]
MAFWILLGVLIFIHEFGHFLAARLCGVGVETFSLGFGPRLTGIRVGLTDYRISLIPLGGYVKMVGDERERELKPEFARLSFNNKPLWQKSLIAAAGPVFNFLLAAIIIFGILFTQGVPIKNGNEFSYQKIGPIKSALTAVVVTGKIAKQQATNIAKMAAGKISVKENLGSPVAIHKMSIEAAQEGLIAFFYLIAKISIGLAIFNLLPIPALDGGHLLFFGIEAVKGGPVSLKTRQRAQVAGVCILLALMVFTIYNDIARRILS